uniref:Regulatory protein E2 n=1 Tax=Rodent papillomavirus TaxID=2050020 RepID=A0A2H4MX75_9PAPI|nr:E2 protein [Rodent papillomavirus]
MNPLEARFDAVQERILNLYEKGSDKLEDQILYWELIRKEGAIEFCARKQGLNKLGLHPVPCQLGAENKAKKAIHMQLQLKSLLESQYGSESWTMQETSTEMYERTEPPNTFKKDGHEVDVMFDCNEDNLVSYMVWGKVYYQDELGKWHKVQSQVDYYGVFYVDHDGNRVYYENFDSDSERFGETGTWTVRHKNQTLTSSPDSSTTTKERPEETDEPKRKRRRSEHTPTSSQESVPTGRREPTQTDSCGHASPRQPGRRGRFGQGEPETLSPLSSPSEGSRSSHEPWTPPGPFGSRYPGSAGPCERVLPSLLTQPRDPPIILVKGPTNSLKCWRNRLRRRVHKPFTKIGTAFSWVEDRDGGWGIKCISCI